MVSLVIVGHENRGEDHLTDEQEERIKVLQEWVSGHGTGVVKWLGREAAALRQLREETIRSINDPVLKERAKELGYDF